MGPKIREGLKFSLTMTRRQAASIELYIYIISVKLYVYMYCITWEMVVSPNICNCVSFSWYLFPSFHGKNFPPTFATFCCQASGGDVFRETFGLLVLQPLSFPPGFRGHGRRALALALKRGNSI